MADKDVKIHIGTEADTKGAQEAQDALNRVKDAAAGIAPASPEPQSIVPPSIPEDANAAGAALDDLTDAAKETDDALRPSTPPTIVPSTLLDEATAAGISLEDLTDAAEEADKALHPSTPPTILPANLTPDAKKAEEALDGVTSAAEGVSDALNPMQMPNRLLGPEIVADIEEAENALEDVSDAAKKVDDALHPSKPQTIVTPELPKQAGEAQRTIVQLTEELKRLQRELSEAPVGSKAFEDLAGKIKVAQRELDDAEAAARKLGGTVGRRGNAGMAVLEFSRAFEDAQYGIRGVLNNIPGLVAQLGGTAGLAGVISIAAVAATQLWERLGNRKKADEAITSVNRFREVLKSLNSDLDAIREVQSRLSTTDAVEAFNQRKASIDRETRSLEAANAQLLAKIEYEKQLVEIAKRGALQDIDAEERAGRITPAQAAAQRGAVEAAGIEDELRRAKEIDVAREELARQKVEQFRKEKQEAENAAEHANQLLANRQDQIEQLRREGSIRTRLDAQLSRFERQLADAMRPVGGGGLGGFNPNPSQSDRIQAARRGIEDTLADIARQAPLPVQGLEGKDNDGRERVILSAYEREAKRLREANDEMATPSLSDLIKHVNELAAASEAAAEQLAAGEDSIRQLKEANEAGATQRNTLSDAEVSTDARQKLREAEAQLGDNIAGSLAEMIAGLGSDIASNSNAQSAIQAANKILEDGLQKGDAEQLSALANAIASQSKQASDATNKALTGFQKNLEDAVGVLGPLLGRVDELSQELRTLKNRMRLNGAHPNY